MPHCIKSKYVPSVSYIFLAHRPGYEEAAARDNKKNRRFLLWSISYHVSSVTSMWPACLAGISAITCHTHRPKK